MPAWSYARQTIFNPRSRACFWKHPWQAGRMVLGAGVNRLLDLDDRLRRGAGGRKARRCTSPGLMLLMAF